MKKLSKTSVIFFILILICFILSIMSFFSEKTISTRENRSLDKIIKLDRESYFSGDYFESVESFITDHIPYREEFLDFNENIRASTGINTEVKAIGNKTSPYEKDSKIDRKIYKTQTNNIAVLNIDNQMLETFVFNESLINRYSVAINNISKNIKIRNRNINIFAEIVPNYIGILHEDFLDYSDPEDKAIEYIYNNLGDSIIKINPFTELKNNREDYLYYRTDHHWASRGAYIGAKEFIEALGYEIDDLSEFDRSIVRDFTGFLWKNNPVDKPLEKPDYIEIFTKDNLNPTITTFYYDKEGGLSSYKQPMFQVNDLENVSYGTFLNGDYPLLSVQNEDQDNQRNLLIIKDSYANAFLPWVYPYFQNMVMVDPRYFKENISDLIENNYITDVLFLNYILTPTDIEYIDFLENIYQDNKLNELE